MTFWEHLDELRGCIVKVVIAALIGTVVAFFFKDALFYAVLAPKGEDFVTYRLFDAITKHHSSFYVELINVELTQQFMTHVKVALWAGLLLVSPYVLYVLFGFVAPALYKNERRYAVRAVAGGYVMFLVGVAVNYFLLFPLTFRFLGNYQVSDEVTNMISLTSYINILLLMSLVMGVLFELPVVSWILAKVGILRAEPMAKYRKHAIVAILILAAIITPTGDVVTLSVVALPIYLLYEASILIVRWSYKA